MSDSLRHVAPGEPLRFPAAAYNAFADAARAYQSGRLKAAGRPQFLPAVPSLEVLIRNDTGGDLAAGSVLLIGDPVTSAVDQPFAVRRSPAFAGTEPTDREDPVVILSEPVPDGGFGRAVAVGLAVTRVTGSGPRAYPTAGSTAGLTAGTSGRAEVLWSDSGTGERAAVVLLGSDPTASGDGDDCGDCGWLLGLKESATADRVLRARVKGGFGRCSCVDADESEDFKLLWDVADQDWKGIIPVRLCCGCAALTFRVDPGEPLTNMASGSLEYDRSCQDADGDPSTPGTIALKQACCGTTTDGQPFVKLIADTEDGCDGDRTGCKNTLEITVECSTCDLANPACGRCAEAVGPPFYKITVSFTGAYARFSGTHHLRRTASCTWTTGCEETGVSYTFEIVADAGTENYTLRLTIEDADDTLVWEVQYVGERPLCFQTGGFSLLYRDGPGGSIVTPPTGVQESLGVEPVKCSGSCDEFVGDLPDTLYVTINGLTFTISQGPAGFWQGNNGVPLSEDPANSAGITLTFDAETCSWDVGLVASFCGPSCAAPVYAVSYNPLLITGTCTDPSGSGCPSSATFTITDEPPP